MAFSFSSWFKGKNPDEEIAPEEVAPPAPPAPQNGTSPRPLVAPAGVHSAQPNARPPAARPPGSMMPNGGQPANLRQSGPRAPVPLGTRPPAVSAVPAPPKVSPAVPPNRKIAFGGPDAPLPAIPAASHASEEPEPPAPALPETTIRLAVGDFLDRLPAALLAPGNHARDQEVEFLSTELYSDLAKGRASVPASAIYEKCPALFTRPISETEDVEVQLPLAKVVEQLSGALQTRPDQFSEANTTEIETPFLHVANEDNARLPKANGTTVGALPASVTRGQMRRTGHIQTISPLKTPPEIHQPLAAPTAATAGSINSGKRPPSTVRASVAGGKIRVSGSTNPPRGMVPAPVQPDASVHGAPAPQEPSPVIPPLPMASPSHQVAKKTARIQIPPISLRTNSAPGAPGARQPATFAPPSVPTPTVPPPSFRSNPPSEQPMPSFRPAPPAASEPIAFRLPPPPPPPSTKRVPASFAPGVRPSFPPPAFPAVPPISEESPAAPLPAARFDDRKINLSLAAILKGLPSSALVIDPSTIGNDQRVELPFSLIEGQLSQGRVSVSRDTLVQALPENRHDIFSPEMDLQEIPLPLQEVFQNLPGNALSIRPDQIVEEATHDYPTPFSQKAEEDALRLGMVQPGPPAAEEPPAPVEMAAAPVTEAPAEAQAEPEAESTEPAQENLIDTEEASSVETTPPEKTAEVVVLLPDKSFQETAPERESVSAAHATPEEVEAARSEALETAAETQPVEAPASLAADLNDIPPQAEFAPAPSEEPVPSPEALAAPEMAELPEPAVDVSAPALPVPEPAEPAFGTDEIPTTAAPFVPEPAATAKAPETAPTPVDTVLQTLFMTEDSLDAKSLIRHVSALPGLDGCTIMFNDGLLLAGNFPEGEEKSGFTAMAPTVIKRAAAFCSDVQLGNLDGMTLHTAAGMVSFFTHGNLCLSVRHAGRGFLPGVREKLVIVARELARTYSPDTAA